MKIKSFDQLTSMELDTLREIGNIGTGNAATALGELLNREVRITMAEVRESSFLIFLILLYRDRKKRGSERNHVLI